MKDVVDQNAPKFRSVFVPSAIYRVLSNQPLDPAMATDWSITHSPTPRYLSTHFPTSLFSPATLSVLKLKSPNVSLSLESAIGRHGRIGGFGFEIEGEASEGRCPQGKERIESNSRQTGRALHSSEECRNCYSQHTSSQRKPKTGQETTDRDRSPFGKLELTQDSVKGIVAQTSELRP